MPTTLALQSQELTSLDFFLQGYVMDMYASHTLDMHNWQLPFSAVALGMLECMWIEADWLLII